MSSNLSRQAHFFESYLRSRFLCLPGRVPAFLQPRRKRAVFDALPPRELHLGQTTAVICGQEGSRSAAATKRRPFTSYLRPISTTSVVIISVGAASIPPLYHVVSTMPTRHPKRRLLISITTDYQSVSCYDRGPSVGRLQR
jgi:hypothetical protein